jgi:glutathione synthase/RimK-type ligase-like ATP-grasp enzyme
MKVAYVGCQWSLISGKQRRSNAIDHDREFLRAIEVFRKFGDQLEEVDWRGFDFDRCDFDLIFVRTTWDYVRHKSEFLRFLQRADEVSLLANSSRIINWNLEKYYLAELGKRGLPILNSLFLEHPMSVSDVLDTLGTDEIVVKPVLGEGGYGMRRYDRHHIDEHGTDMISAEYYVQPFTNSVSRNGEFSLVFIGGRYSHAALKRCKAGEYRTQISHGGTEEAYRACAREIELASQFVSALPDSPLACRIDLIRDGDELFLMEVEAIEPILYPHFLPDFGSVIHSACREYIAQRG